MLFVLFQKNFTIFICFIFHSKFFFIFFFLFCSAVEYFTDFCSLTLPVDLFAKNKNNNNNNTKTKRWMNGWNEIIFSLHCEKVKDRLTELMALMISLPRGVGNHEICGSFFVIFLYAVSSSVKNQFYCFFIIFA